MLERVIAQARLNNTRLVAAAKESTELRRGIEMLQASSARERGDVVKAGAALNLVKRQARDASEQYAALRDEVALVQSATEQRLMSVTTAQEASEASLWDSLSLISCQVAELRCFADGGNGG